MHLIGLIIAGQHIHHDVDAGAEGMFALRFIGRNGGQNRIARVIHRPCARKIIADLFGDIRISKEESGIYAEYDKATDKLLLAAGGLSTNLVAGARTLHCRQRVLILDRASVPHLYR